jgi:hypothetical protein
MPLSPEDRHELIASAVLSIAGHIDQSSLYINQGLAAHCVALFAGIEDIYDTIESDKKPLLTHYRKMRADAYRMIKEDSGVTKINKLFQSINRPRISGPIVEAIAEMRRDRRNAKKGEPSA